MLRSSITRNRNRRGVILLVVISLLTLFAVVGLSFVFYAEGQANSSRIWREAKIDPDDDLLVLRDDQINIIIGAMLYGVDDRDGVGNPAPQSVRTATYGHDIASAIYGWNLMQPVGSNGNTIPYNGVGVYQDGNEKLVRYAGNPTRRPELYDMNGDTIPETYIPKNANYTYPDRKDLYLAAVRASDGLVLTPSFHRDYLFDWGNATDIDPTPGNPARFRTLRPHPSETNPNFPKPIANDGTNGTVNTTALLGRVTYGDVENIPNKAVGVQYDSFWMDQGLPDVKYRGKIYRPLIAPLIVDQDNRININVAGNCPTPITVVAYPGDIPATAHSSNQGWGPWEMNLSKVIKHPTLDPQGARASHLVRSEIFPNAARFSSRYPLKIYDQRPVSGLLDEFPPGTAAAPYATVDFDGAADTNPDLTGTTPHAYQLPQLTTYNTLPTFHPRYANGSGKFENPVGSGNFLRGERTFHPGFFNPYYYQNGLIPNKDYNRVFGLETLTALNAKYNFDPSGFAKSELTSLVPYLNQQFGGAGNPNPRFLITPMSNDVDRIGLPPWQTNLSATSFTRQPAAAIGAYPPQPTGTPMPFPTPPIAPNPLTSDFSSATDYSSRASNFLLAPLDVNRGLADYRKDPSKPFEGIYVAGTGYTPNIDPLTTVPFAIQDRQNLASDIYDRLVFAAYGMPKSLVFQMYTTLTPAQQTPVLDALRWLAQMSVNIVDYIDVDDYITPFKGWNPANPADTVFGTEMPRLVLNELYMRVVNDPTDPKKDAMGLPAAQKDYFLEFYLELLNPLTLPKDPTAPFNVPHSAALTYNGNPVYQIIVTPSPNPGMHDAANTAGDPNYGAPAYTNPDIVNPPAPNVLPPTPAPPQPTGLALVDPTANPNEIVEPLDLNTPTSMPGTGADLKSQPDPKTTHHVGFYAVGSQPNLPTNPPPPPMTPPTITQIPSLQYTIRKAANAITFNPTIYLQRLAVPHLPYDPINNPYITVDYVTAVPGQIYDSRTVTSTGNNAALQKLDQHHSFGRRQPLAGNQTIVGDNNLDLYLKQNQVPSPTFPLRNPPTAGSDSFINNTFFFQNSTFDPTTGQPADSDPVRPNGNPFDWLTHLDRALISPVELFQVSAYPPHDLLNRFKLNNTPAQTFMHRAIWTDSNNPVYSNPAFPNAQTVAQQSNQYVLYRALGLLETRSRMLGIGAGSRVPGRVNINTIWDIETFRAICDAQPAGSPPLKNPNHFDESQVDAIWSQRILPWRTPMGSPQSTMSVVAPSTRPDRPFVGITSPYSTPDPKMYKEGSGIERTLLQPGLFDVNPVAPNPPSHPYVRNELFTKIFNNLTTRSNVFAVYVTLGYFEVDPTTGKLGAELGTDDGNRIRHRFFSIIDRSNLSIKQDGAFRTQGARPVFYSFEPKGAVDEQAIRNIPTSGPVPVTVRIPTQKMQDPAVVLATQKLMGIYENTVWNITPGTQVLIDPGPNQEFATVQSVAYFPPDSTTQDAGGGEIMFQQLTKPHLRGVTIMFGSFDNNTVPLLGNPGPQANFDYKQDRYSHVVPLVVELKD